MKACIACLLTLVAIQGPDLNDPEHPKINESSAEYLKGTPAAVKFLVRSDFRKGLEEHPPFGASSGEDFDQLVRKINHTSTVSDVGIGDADTEYDVILQPGHYQRTKGSTGTAGKYVSEQALVAYVTNIVAEKLHGTGERVLVVSADNYLRPTTTDGKVRGLHAKLFLAVHADGSKPPCNTGPSLGYQKPATALAMNFVALGLADALGYNFTSFRKNFTANEAKYYMFDKVQTTHLTGLLEVGELTCENTERELINSSHGVGANIARAIDFILRTPEAAPSSPTSPKVKPVKNLPKGR